MKVSGKLGLIYVWRTYYKLGTMIGGIEDEAIKTTQFLRSVIILRKGRAPDVTVIVVGNGHGDTTSKPGRDWLHFT